MIDIDDVAETVPETKPEHLELQSLVNQVVGIKAEPTDVPPPVRSVRMTNHQIKAMKVVSARQPAQTTQVAANAARTFIQVWDGFLASFKVKERRTRCQKDGHECLHCGARLPNA